MHAHWSFFLIHSLTEQEIFFSALCDFHENKYRRYNSEGSDGMKLKACEMAAWKICFPKLKDLHLEKLWRKNDIHHYYNHIKSTMYDDPVGKGKRGTCFVFGVLCMCICKPICTCIKYVLEKNRLLVFEECLAVYFRKKHSCWLVFLLHVLFVLPHCGENSVNSNGLRKYELLTTYR